MIENKNKATRLMKVFILILFVLLSSQIRAQNYIGLDVENDFIQLKESIKKYNPALYKYNPLFDDKSDSLQNSIPTDSLSAFEAFSFFSKLCALSSEGHFSLGNWEDNVHSGFIENTFKYLPISVKIIDSSLLIWIDFSSEQAFNVGDEILSINGMSSSDILNTLYKSIPADGDIRTYIDRKIELGFSWLFYLYVFRSENFSIETINREGKTKVTKIQALYRDKQIENFSKYYPEKSTKTEELSPFHTLDFNGNFAVLALPTFSYNKIKELNLKSKRFYKDIFKEIDQREIEHLIVDLRGNTGGRNEFADDMVSFIRKPKIEIPFLKRTQSWEGRTRTYKVPRRSRFAFSGKIYVLVDGLTYSAANTLARYLFELANAEIIGEETGTRFEGFAAGSKQAVVLNNSKIRIGIPRYHIYFPESSKQKTVNRGLLPKHVVKYSISDYELGNDLHMKMALSLIK